MDKEYIMLSFKGRILVMDNPPIVGWLIIRLVKIHQENICRAHWARDSFEDFWMKIGKDKA